MKKMIILFGFFVNINSYAFIDPKIGGTIYLDSGLEKNLTPQGVLVVIAKPAGSPPQSSAIAMTKIKNPRFPQAFVITEKNLLVPGTSLKGALRIVARYTATSDIQNFKGGIEGFDPKFPITDVGNNNLNIQLSTLLK